MNPFKAKKEQTETRRDTKSSTVRKADCIGCGTPIAISTKQCPMCEISDPISVRY